MILRWSVLDEPVLTGAERPGDLPKTKKVDVLFTGYKPGQLDAHKIMYITTGIDGSTPVVSTGIRMIPIGGIPASEKKIISYQEANDSVGGYCHPSSHWTGGDSLDGALIVGFGTTGAHVRKRLFRSDFRRRKQRRP